VPFLPDCLRAADGGGIRKGSTFDGAVAAVPLRRNPPFDKASLHSSYGMKTLSGSPTPTSHSPGSGSLLTSARRSEIIA